MSREKSFDDYDEGDLLRAFAKISNTRRASAVTLGDTCRQLWRQDIWCVLWSS